MNLSRIGKLGDDQRSARRLPVHAGSQDAVVDVSNRRLNGHVVEQSATGLKVCLPEPFQLKRGALVNVYHDEVWVSAVLVHAVIENGQTILGLKRVSEFVPMPKFQGIQKARRLIVPGSAVFIAIAGMLITLVAAAVIETVSPKKRVEAGRSNRPTRIPDTRTGKSPRQTMATGTPLEQPLRKKRIRQEAARTRNKSKPAVAKQSPPGGPAFAKTNTATTPEPSGLPPEIALIRDENLRDELQITADQRARLAEVQSHTPTSKLAEALLNSLTDAQRRLWIEKTAPKSTESGVSDSAAANAKND